MQDDTVVAESTADATQVAEQTPETSEENVVEPSREDTNTPTTEGTSEETVEVEDNAQEASAEPEYKPNYVTQSENILNFESELQSQIGQAQINPVNQEVPDVRGLQMAQLAAQVTRMEEEKAWEKAISQYPEIRTNKQLDDLVYSTYQVEKARNPQVTPVQTAAKVFKMIEGVKKSAGKQAYQKAEDDIAQKLSDSRTPARRSQSDGSQDPIKTSVDEYKRTGDDRVLLEGLRY